MRGAERVVYVKIGKRSKLFAKCRVVFLLALVEAKILEHDDTTIGQIRRLGPGIFADGIGSKDNGSVDNLGKTRGSRRQGEFLLVAFARRTSKMAHQDDPRSMLYKVRDGGQGCPDARVVAYDAVFDGNVEIDAHKHAFPTHVHAFDGLYIGHDASYDDSSIAAVASCDRNVETKLQTQAKSRSTPPMRLSRPG